ncbi:MAG: molybdenum cofactor biosynthesis protein MoaE [Candidatus Cloacimonadota bacterium]|nr:MAG: molybdenum cofactor biosynthesis protein MoaE [Candidatus Cloacimonadota bacterium]
MFEITQNILKIEDYINYVEDDSHGAIVSFLGVVRNIHEGKSVHKIFYECYDKMALKQMKKIEILTLEKYPMVKMVLVHRVGMVELREASIIVLTSSKHRKDSYEANMFIMDEVKKLLPIWKKEHHPDGNTSWVGIGS